ncbi:hypothetical protein A3J43_03955 [Candidatus Uhrbacteria bacterium RIFCSPHIGHO2_12_FULL_54_23]|uniref:Thiamine-binding protein domain-containing protein n=1 Tax=Candidatus Uhrbacteria bacterium RIFCSPHIGHO2_12_FULL_54_23 TaxID=1802397 RepID=A0A1F7UL79_9BACT|nr:MAG: hypothetical protein A3J43_03955 [Candidatus Uhrbacteria bacterium RIFCSPHIGHO2_12_FULL_54_23]
MPTVSIAFQIMPKTHSPDDAIRLIERAIEIVKQSGISYEVGAMETVMEEERIEELLAIVKRTHDACLAAGAESVFINVKILSNPNGIMSIHEKIAPHRPSTRPDEPKN